MKRSMLLFFSALAMVVSLCAFPGCATTAPKNAQQAVLGVKAKYALALETAVAYTQLPPCVAGQPALTICSNTPVVLQIKVAKDLAKPVIDGAEATVRDPNFDASKSDAILLSAQNALLALTSITNTLTSITHTQPVTP